ncbi:helix-turn-helix transcriptional regulator [Mycobacterium kubicae]|uniref:helix-turn-helix transcriptional regulator n=1 Tax=Mycobacterium kubicae TaxID=120959 RepID=UPI001FD11784|nr:LuxR family transcriptional regulator [Mycobacterium kubicae]
MKELDPRAGMPRLDWSDAGMNEALPSGTVTLLLADVEGSTQLWQSQPDAMTTAIANLDRTLADLVSAHCGIRPVEQGEGDSFVIAFDRASNAAACALSLQRAPLAPLRLRIGLHTGEVQLRDDNNYVGPAINRTARLRELAHGGQTVLSGTTSDLIADTLPDDVWLTELGTHRLRDLPRPERVVQLCHRDLCNDFPPLRVREPLAAHHLPAQLTSFVGRHNELAEVRSLLQDNRLLTLAGAGGVGKTRLAVQVAATVAESYDDGTWYVDLAPLTDPDLVPITVARALGLPDQQGRAPLAALLQFIGGRRLLLVLDNCEHLLDASAELTASLLSSCSRLTLMTTSREPIGVAGEVTWRVPSLSLADDAVRLFGDRASQARPGWCLSQDSTATVAEICRRLDGVPLAIELAAARVRALSPEEILAGLQDRFRLLTGGSRMAVRRQQTLQASVDWSHALLTEPERVVFRRLAVFQGGFDLQACQEVVCGDGLARAQVFDVLALLVDKSLVIAETSGGATRYRLLETMRQYAQEKLGASAEAAVVRQRHCDYYTALAAAADAPTTSDLVLLLDRAERELDNLRAAFAWSREIVDTDNALQLATSLQPLWLTRGLVKEGSDWLRIALAEAEGGEAAPAAVARALADKAYLDNMRDAENLARAERALAIARELDDPALLARALTTCGRLAAWTADLALPYLAEAEELARAIGDRRRLGQVLYSQALNAVIGTGDLDTALRAGTEGRDLAEAIGDRNYSLGCQYCLGAAQMARGDVTGTEKLQRRLMVQADAEHDLIWQVSTRSSLCHALANTGRADEARAVGLEALDGAAELGRYMEGVVLSALAFAALAGGDVDAAVEANESARERWDDLLSRLATTVNKPGAQVALTIGDLVTARRLADHDVAAGHGWFTVHALSVRARVAMAQDQLGRAEQDAHDALAGAAEMGAHLFVPDLLECLAVLAGEADSHLEAARLFGAAHAMRQRTKVVRFKIYDTQHAASVDLVRTALGKANFHAAFIAGSKLSTSDAIAYAQRGRGERKRPTRGWDSLTPTELDVVRLVREGLGNKDIAVRLFVSPRTVQTHLTHVFSKLGLTSRLQLAQEAARHD